MTVIVHEKKTLASLPTSPTLSQELGEALVGMTPEEAKLFKESHIRANLVTNPKYDIWEPLVYYWTNGTVLQTDLAYVSIKGAIAYEVDGDLHINHGDLEGGNPQVSLTILGDQHTLQLGRALASTFLTVPDVYKGIKESDLEVIHLDGQPHQCHLLNLEWKLNKSEAEADVIEKTVKVLNNDLPTQE